jgi:heme exporter protein D
MELGPHAAFIWSSYAVVGIVLAWLIGWLWLDGRRQAREVEQLERRGLGRGHGKSHTPAMD